MIRQPAAGDDEGVKRVAEDMTMCYSVHTPSEEAENDWLNNQKQLQAQLSSEYADLVKSSNDTANEGKDKIDLHITNLKSMISDALNSGNYNQVAELHQSAKYIDYWLHEEGIAEQLEGLEVKFDSVRLPSVKSHEKDKNKEQENIDLPFDDYLHGLSRSGILPDLQWSVEHVESYLRGLVDSDVADAYKYYDAVIAAGTSQDKYSGLVLVIRLTDLEPGTYFNMQLPLKGISEYRWSSFLEILEGYLQPLRENIQEAGGQVPGETISEFVNYHL